jgi:hypothetical protein
MFSKLTDDCASIARSELSVSVLQCKRPCSKEVAKQPILQCIEDHAPRRLRSNQSFNALKTMLQGGCEATNPSMHNYKATHQGGRARPFVFWHISSNVYHNALSDVWCKSHSCVEYSNSIWDM